MGTALGVGDPPDPVTGARKASRRVITVEPDDILSVIQIRTGTRADTIANHRSVDRYLHRETVPRPSAQRRHQQSHDAVGELDRLIGSSIRF
jgi:hypothetical protein